MQQFNPYALMAGLQQQPGLPQPATMPGVPPQGAMPPRATPSIEQFANQAAAQGINPPAGNDPTQMQQAIQQAAKAQMAPPRNAMAGAPANMGARLVGLPQPQFNPQGGLLGQALGGMPPGQLPPGMANATPETLANRAAQVQQAMGALQSQRPQRPNLPGPGRVGGGMTGQAQPLRMLPMGVQGPRPLGQFL